MNKVPYASIMGNLMYVMICTIPYIAHVVGTINHFCQIQVKSIEMLWNGFLGISVVLVIWDFVLEVINLL